MVYMLYIHHVEEREVINMNMRVARQELREPPKIRPLALVLEALLFVGMSFMLASVLS